MNKTINERGEVITDNTATHKIVREYSEQQTGLPRREYQKHTACQNRVKRKHSLSRLITRSEIEFVIKKQLPEKNSPRLDNFKGESYGKGGIGRLIYSENPNSQFEISLGVIFSLHMVRESNFHYESHSPKVPCGNTERTSRRAWTLPRASGPPS